MDILKKIIKGMIVTVSCSVAQAGVITQSFDSSWLIDVWDYYGDVSAMEWEYQIYTPWDDSLGNLTSVVISTDLSGTRADADDDLRIRSGFFTGWNPVNYQYSRTTIIDGGDNHFSTTLRQSYTTSEEIAVVSDYTYFTGIYDSGAGTGGAWYYFESRTENNTHSIEAKTTLSYFFDPIVVPTPATFAIFGIALAGLNFMRRKK
jgi:hypothetical protein